MSVATPVINSWDGPNRRIYLKQGVTAFHWIDDIYFEYRNARKLETDNIRKFEPFMVASGNEPKGLGKFTPRLLKLLLGVKVIPFDEAGIVTVTGEAITDDADNDATLFDVSQITQAVILKVQPPGAEIIRLDDSAIQFASFMGRVTLDTGNGTGNAVAGTPYPTGTRRVPSLLLSDADLIADTVGLEEFLVLGNLFIDDSATALQGHSFVGDSRNKTTITIDPSANVLDCEFYEAKIQGTLDGNSYIEKCSVLDLDYVYGELIECRLYGTITLGGGTIAHITDCQSGIAGESTPIVDFDHGTNELTMNDYHGGILLKNKTQAGNITIALGGGQIRIDLTSCTDGRLVARGIGKVVDDATGNHLPSGNYNGFEILNETLMGTHFGGVAIANGALTAEQATMLVEMYKLQGLDINNPMTLTLTQRSVDDIDLALTGDGETSTTVTRQ